MSLLAIRITLAYGFFGPAIKKINNFENIIAWFENGLKLPMLELMAYLATGSEALGVVLLTLGLATRFISVPLLVTMFVAIFLVHGLNNFACKENGYEVAMYYAIMLLTLISFGPGKISLDETFLKKFLPLIKKFLINCY